MTNSKLQRLATLGSAPLIAVLMAGPAFAQAAAAAPAPKIDSGDTAWMLTSSVLVLMMTIPGLALFYAGMVRKKNILATLAQSFGATALITVLWMVIGYSIAFTDGGANNALIGGVKYLLLGPMGLTATSPLAATIPESVYMFFQMTFAIITPALIAGALADRMKFSAFLAFMGAWLILVYCPIAHWVWGGGWLGKAGALDFAGGTVVHLNAGTAGLVAALMLGKRKGFGTENMAPHNLAYSVIGASLLWVGWFGFNAGSAVTSGAQAGMAAAATQIATAGASLAWMVAEWIVARKPSVLGMISGAVAGLVAITPASGFVNPGDALLIGIAAGVVCYLSAVHVKHIFKYDDALDAWGVHGVGGALGALLTGVFASSAINSASKGWLHDGNLGQMVLQLEDIGATFAYCAVVTFAILLVIKLTIGLRVSEEVEVEGLDLNLHGEVVQA
ncbi:MAG TPA: ammonium transporter [Phenylobacterium sp.]|uniref:ammonium transporter n=1 Tax=Phenylobacterium sp. TaxID=1871053 RepID=UPI002BAB2948|nr:ammonium transporter [Phenylobacterium sp.]HSV02460.1 ammonium transporter [Phenylobacterium sp.]